MVSISEIEDQVRRERLMKRRYWTKLPYRWILLTTVYTMFSMLPILFPEWWAADLIANLRVQGTLLGIPLLAITMIYQAWKPMLLMLVLLGYHTSWFFFPGPVSRAAPEVAVEFTVMAANVYTGNRNYETIEQQFREGDADVIVVSELSHGLAEHLKTSFLTDYPHVKEFPADRGNFGMGLYSRLPLDDASIEFFNQDSIPTIIATVTTSNQRFHVIGVHTLPPMTEASFEHRERHLSQIAAWVKEAQAGDPKIASVVAGDFNLTPWTARFHHFQEVSELELAADGLLMRPTWYRWPVFPFGLVLDHVMLSKNLQCISRTIGDPAGSDHRFVTVQIGVKD